MEGYPDSNPKPHGPQTTNFSKPFQAFLTVFPETSRLENSVVSWWGKCWGFGSMDAIGAKSDHADVVSCTITCIYI